MSTSALHHGPESFSSDTSDQHVWKAAKRTGLKARPDRSPGATGEPKKPRR
jgi:hypothetical protein